MSLGFLIAPCVPPFAAIAAKVKELMDLLEQAE